MQYDSFTAAKGRERERRKEQGYFDGRFRAKTIPNKKKEAERKASRNNKVTSW